ncbi:MAG: hypothetical protein AAF487_05395 [Bacteroidota bacterium]
MNTKHLYILGALFLFCNAFKAQNWDHDLSTFQGQQDRLDMLIEAANSTELSTSYYEWLTGKLNELAEINPSCENLSFGDTKMQTIDDLIMRIETWKYITIYLWYSRFKDITSDELEDRIRKEISCNYYNEPLSPEQNVFLRDWFRDYDKNGYGILTFRKLNCDH